VCRALPHLTPLLAASQRLIPHIVVVTDRLGAEIIVARPDDTDVHTEVVGDESHVTRSAPGGWSQRRFQQRAENRWDANARDVADALTRLVDEHQPRLVVISGDVRAVQFLRDQLPTQVSDLLMEVGGDYQGLNEALRRCAGMLADWADAETMQVLEKLSSEQARGDLAAIGTEATLRALTRGQVDTVLLDPSRTGAARAFFDPASSQAATQRDKLLAAGVPDLRSAELDDVVIRAALRTGAAVRIVPAGSGDLPGDGVAAVLRYS
jgi:peptide subunit release factor 1 (eRF1)